MTLNFNAAPYYDNYDETNGFYRILFKPGYAVQTRELNQLQTIINKQVEVTGKWLFKEGAMVLGGVSSVDTKANYVIFVSGTDVINTAPVGTVLTGATSGVTAKVIHVEDAAGVDLPTVFVKYTNSGSDTETKTFANNETIYDQNNNSVGLTKATNATGTGSIASVTSGFYFIKNAFVYVEGQTIVLDKYSNTPSYKVGLDVTESFVTSDMDQSLLDNAQGSFNYAAPGADRYGITLTLVKKNLDDTSDESNFIQLKVVKNGNILRSIDHTQNSILEQTLARRTFDESGDYTVKPFLIDVREYRNNFRGQWTAYEYYLAGDVVTNNGNFYSCRMDGQASNTAPVQTVGSTLATNTGVIWTYESNPYYNRGVNDVALGEGLDSQRANAANLAIGLEPGKAYVQGYEIEKTSTEFTTLPKSRDVTLLSNVKIPATVGNYVLVTNVHSLPDISSFPVVSLYNQLTSSGGVAAGTLVGTARIRLLEFNSDSAPGLSTTHYMASLFNITMNAGYNFNRDVKQLFIAGGSTATSFSSDVVSVLTPLSGSISASSTTITGTGSLFATDFKVGDYISVNIAGTEYRRRITVITSNTSLTIASAFGVTVTGEKYSRVQTALREAENESLIFPATRPYVKTVRDADGNCNTSYTAIKRFVKTAVDIGSDATITLTVTGNDTFASAADASNYLVVDNTTGSVVLPLAIDGADTQQLVITVDNDSAIEYVVFATINRNGVSTEKTKTLSTTTVTITDKATATAASILLGKADGYRILQVLQDTGTFASPTGTYSTDITSRYTFDDGQTATYYGLAKALLNVGEVPPTAPIQITFEYFAHSGTGDYFTVNSYISSIAYDKIPTYNGVPLSFAFDFRPRINDAGTSFGEVLMPKRGIDIEADYQHYLARKDKVILNQNGSFFTLQGTPSINPQDITAPNTGMTLYNLTLLPYNYAPSSVLIETIDNKRYTMRDIGRLEKRISNIEYYTSLSLLEQDTQSLEIQDADGFNRFKNGFIVDNFTGNSVSDIYSPDYKCAIDMEKGHLRPSYYMDNINLIEKNTSDTQRTTDGYQVTGDLVTLPYSEVEMIKQLDASRVENINPFAIFTFIGNAILNPASDDWFETTRLPDIHVNADGNFNSIYSAAAATGALSGVWNAWQTQWTGVQTSQTTYSADTRGIGTWDTQRTTKADTSVDALNALAGTGSGRGPHRKVTVDATTTTSAQTRTGVRTVITPKVDTTTTGDVVLSKAVIPYIRARSVLFIVKGMKPNTTFTPFFDSVNVGVYCTPASTLVVSRSTSFDPDTVTGGDASEAGRLIGGNVDSSLDKGDLIYVKQRGTTVYTKQTSPATAVLSMVTNPMNGTTTTLNIVNPKGTFQVGDIVAGSISGATATIQASGIQINTLGQSLVSNSVGEVVGLFAIPNTDSSRFRTGTREFKLSDDVLDNPAHRTSYVRKSYVAEGVLNTTQATITSTRNADVRTEAMNDYRTVVQTSNRVVSDSGWYDPLAQTFLVDSSGGAFVTSVDVFFASKDENIPVRMQIREVVNGYPGKNIIPFSEVVLNPVDVNISTTNVTTGQGDILPAPIATNFKFKSPVYLNDKTEYCVVLMSDSNSYKAWISQLGDKSVMTTTTDRIISEQPYMGVLFKSQNGSTWTGDQSQDLMFKINKAKFDINNYGEVDFINTALNTQELDNQPFYTVTGTNYVRVTHNNHGMFAGSVVVISNVSGPVGGISATEFNTEHTIISAELDSYIIQVTSNATYTGNFGDTGVIATRNIEYNTVQPIMGQFLFPDTDMTHYIRTTTGKSVQGNETPYSVATSFEPVTINQNNNLTDLQLITNSATETTSMSGNKSVILRSRMISTNENVSPAIDTSRLSLITVQDRITNSTQSNTNYPALDARSLVSGVTTVAVTNGNQFSTSDTATKAAFLTTAVGKYITTTGFAAPANNGTFLVTAISTDGSAITVNAALTNVSAGATVTVKSLDRFIDEIAPYGSSNAAKYVTKKINLQNPSTFLKIKFAADIEQAANVAVYYKLELRNSSVDFNTIPYTLATATSAPVISTDGIFHDAEYDIENLPEFTAVQVKIVSTSARGADIVRIRDLQIVGCA